ncbi:dihydrofolate reductase [Leptolyngbya sp. NIES-3755]|nr:dihydrofolate reductase [Leptolyngbya sp. NIES-3755]
MPEVILIAAIAQTNGVIGNRGKLPWSIPEDLQRFRQLTLNHTVIMGRKTWEFDLQKRPLSHRINVIVSSQSLESDQPNVEFVRSLSEALDRSAEKLFVIGGAMIYEQAIDFVEILELTWVEGDFQGDVIFPVKRDRILEAFDLIRVDQRTGFKFEMFRRK